MPLSLPNLTTIFSLSVPQFADDYCECHRLGLAARNKKPRTITASIQAHAAARFSTDPFLSFQGSSPALFRWSILKRYDPAPRKERVLRLLLAIAEPVPPFGWSRDVEAGGEVWAWRRATRFSLRLAVMDMLKTCRPRVMMREVCYEAGCFCSHMIGQ